MIREFSTDFEFKGERKYIHSSTLIETLSAIVDKHFYPREAWALPRVDGQFHREIQTNGILRVAGEGETPDAVGALPARFTFRDGSERFNALFVEEPDRAVNRRIEPVYSVHEIRADGEFAGTCVIDGSHRRALVENIIEANKRLHVMTLLDRGTQLKVANLYVKGFPISLPREQTEHSGSLLLDIRNRSTRHRADSLVTLNTLHFPEMDTGHFEMCFAVYGL